MLSLFTLFLAVAISLASGQGSPSYAPPSYPGGSYGYGRNYYAEIAEASSRVVALNENDIIITDRLSGVGVKIGLVNNFREVFESTTLPAIKASMAAQDARIQDITAQLKALSVLFDEVDALNTQVQNLVSDLKEVRESRVEVEGDLSRLENEDIVQDQGIAGLESQVDFQYDLITSAEEKVADNEEFVEQIYQRTIQVVDIVNLEKSEVFTIALDSNNTVVSQLFSSPFASKPDAVWGITQFSATEVQDGAYPSDPYASDDLETLYTHVDVVNDENGFTAKLVDQSNRWIVDRVVIRLSFFLIDSSILNVH